MTGETPPLSDIVAANTLIEQGILPGAEIDKGKVTPSDVAGATRSLVENVNDLPLEDDARRRERILHNAATKVEVTLELLDSQAIRRDIIILGVRNAFRRRQRRPIANR